MPSLNLHVTRVGQQGNPAVVRQVGSTGYGEIGFDFVTGANATTAEIWVRKYNGTGKAYFDDFSVVRRGF